MKEWLQIAGLAIMGLLLVFVIIAFAGFFITVGLAVVGVLAVAWLIGMPIKVSRNGKTIGHYRRTTFYPVRRPLDQSDD